MTSPRVLLLDEPSGGIEPSIVDQIANTLRGISERRGVTVVLVEQNLDFAFAVSERGYMLEKGRIAAEGPVDQLRDNDLIKEYLAV